MARERLGPSLALLREAALELRNLQRDPDAAFVIAATLVVIAPVMLPVAVPMLVKIPVVGMIAEGYAGDANMGFRVPAITFAVTRHVGVGGNGRCGYASESQKR